jgi:hypothetical protein
VIESPNATTSGRGSSVVVVELVDVLVLVVVDANAVVDELALDVVVDDVLVLGTPVSPRQVPSCVGLVILNRTDPALNTFPSENLTL